MTLEILTDLLKVLQDSEELPTLRFKLIQKVLEEIQRLLGAGD